LNRFYFKLVVQSGLYLIYKTKVLFTAFDESKRKKTMNPSVNKGTTI